MYDDPLPVLCDCSATTVPKADNSICLRSVPLARVYQGGSMATIMPSGNRVGLWLTQTSICLCTRMTRHFIKTNYFFCFRLSVRIGSQQHISLSFFFSFFIFGLYESLSQDMLVSLQHHCKFICSYSCSINTHDKLPTAHHLLCRWHLQVTNSCDHIFATFPRTVKRERFPTAPLRQIDEFLFLRIIASFLAWVLLEMRKQKQVNKRFPSYHS